MEIILRNQELYSLISIYIINCTSCTDHRLRLQYGEQIGCVGVLYNSIGDYGRAMECHQERLCIARDHGTDTDRAKCYRLVVGGLY